MRKMRPFLGTNLAVQSGFASIVALVPSAYHNALASPDCEIPGTV